MTKLADKFEPIDIIAIIIIVFCFASMMYWGDDKFKDILLIITGFYFGIKVKNGNGKIT